MVGSLENQAGGVGGAEEQAAAAVVVGLQGDAGDGLLQPSDPGQVLTTCEQQYFPLQQTGQFLTL